MQASPLLEKWNVDELRYSNVWEDFRCLESALNTQTNVPQNILSIGSSGDNALALLKFKPQKLIIIDISPAQMALVELKILALKHLSFEEFHTLFASNKNESRIDLFKKIKNDLTQTSKDFWARNDHMIYNGVLVQGRLDQYFQKFRDKVLPHVWNQDLLHQLISAQSLDEQIKIWSQGNLNLLKQMATEFFSKSALSEEGRHASQFEYVQEENTGKIFLQNFIKLIHNQLVSQNPYLFLFLTGQPLMNMHSLPLYKKEDYATIKNQLNKAELVLSDLESFLQKNSAQFDFMNLSDIFEYLSPEQTQHLFENLASHLSPEGQLAYWTLLVDRKPQHLLKIQSELSRQIFNHDRTWFYSQFYVLQRNFKN